MEQKTKAAILDMDGVLTITATVHAKAWKKLFDEFAAHWEGKQGQRIKPFDVTEDYPKHVDGIPRHDGIKRFLKSRDISLPFGEENDPPGFDTICALGNKKNEFFHEQLKDDGVEVYQENIEALKKWKAKGLTLAVISSSKNCKNVLERADLLHLFDVRVDGVVSKEKGLKGKPAPDIFLEAAQQLGVDKEHALVVEDAQLGVEAAKKGGFERVVGFSPDGNQSLINFGADEVVDSLKSLDVNGAGVEAEELPSALDNFDEIKQHLLGKEPVFFFDYDGTLTPIVKDHTEAFISDEMRGKLKTIAGRCLAGVVSGRGLDDVRERVGAIEGFYYIGSHGFEIAGPDNFYDQHEEAAKQISSLDEAQGQLEEVFTADEKVAVERKKFAIAVHYRNTPEDSIPAIEKEVEKVLKEHPFLKKGAGKKILELKPDVDWDKGHAIQFLMKKLKVDNSDYLPVYLGDDITDEDAFQAIRDTGIGILVGKHGESSYAQFSLKNVEEVGGFLDKIIELIK